MIELFQSGIVMETALCIYSHKNQRIVYLNELLYGM